MQVTQQVLSLEITKHRGVKSGNFLDRAHRRVNRLRSMVEFGKCGGDIHSQMAAFLDCELGNVQMIVRKIDDKRVMLILIQSFLVDLQERQ